MSEAMKKTWGQEQAIRDFLRKYQNASKSGQLLRQILEEIGQYYDADRAYLFEVNEAFSHASNTVEWCRPGILPAIDDLQKIPIEGMEFWFREFRENGEFCVRSLSRDYSPDSKTYQLLAPQGIESLMAAPLMVPDGVVYLQARISFVWEKSGQVAVVIGTRNVDELIQKERQQELALQEAFLAAEAASRVKTEFLSNMSHDIRTPMNGIIGMTAIAAAHLDDRERVQDSLQKITRAIRAMARSYCRRVPIVAMTANAFAEDVQAAKTVGMNEHIAKPLDLVVLARTLKKWIR